MSEEASTYQIVEGRAAYAQALRETLLALCTQGCREIFCVDASLAEWPWSDRAVIEALTAWAHRGRMLHLQARNYDALRQRHPRFVQWRVTFDHCVDAREYELEGGDTRAPVAALFGAGAEPHRSVRLLDASVMRAVSSFEAGDKVLLQQWFDALAQRSVPAFPASTLGL